MNKVMLTNCQISFWHEICFPWMHCLYYIQDAMYVISSQRKQIMFLLFNSFHSPVEQKHSYILKLYLFIYLLSGIQTWTIPTQAECTTSHAFAWMFYLHCLFIIMAVPLSLSPSLCIGWALLFLCLQGPKYSELTVESSQLHWQWRKAQFWKCNHGNPWCSLVGQHGPLKMQSWSFWTKT